MKRVIFILIVAALMALAFFAGRGSVMEQGASRVITLETEAIENTLLKQQAAWNRGDIPEFMQGYWQSPDLRFASGGTINTGWQVTLDRYLSRYPDKAAMGQLEFSDLETRQLSSEDALVFGRWKLIRQKDAPSGLFTLHMQKIDGKWLVVSDHTSSAD